MQSRNLGLISQTVSDQLAEGKVCQSNLRLVILDIDTFVHNLSVTNLERTVHTRARPPYHTTTACPAATACRLTFSTRKCEWLTDRGLLSKTWNKNYKRLRNSIAAALKKDASCDSVKKYLSRP